MGSWFCELGISCFESHAQFKKALSLFCAGKAIYLGWGNHMARRLSLREEPGMKIERKEGAQRPVAFLENVSPFWIPFSLLNFSVR
jgi:hypothetical protein